MEKTYQVDTMKVGAHSDHRKLSTTMSKRLFVFSDFLDAVGKKEHSVRVTVVHGLVRTASLASKTTEQDAATGR